MQRAVKCGKEIIWLKRFLRGRKICGLLKDLAHVSSETFLFLWKANFGLYYKTLSTLRLKEDNLIKFKKKYNYF